MSLLIRVVRFVISRIGFPSFLIRIINIADNSVNIHGHQSATISRSCKLKGEIEFEKGARLGNGCYLSGDINIGKRANINRNVEIIGDVSIGSYTAVAREVIFHQVNHDTTFPAMNHRFYDQMFGDVPSVSSDGPINVGHDVWIGTRVIVLSGVNIGDGAVIGAGSVVTSDVEPYSITAGVPAKRIRWRFSRSKRQMLSNLEWWDWSDTKLKENKEFFETELTKKSKGELSTIVE
jgi:virginiamycin A acetyltransferase